MTSSVHVALGAACLAVGLGLIAASFVVRNEAIGWLSRPGLLLILVGGVLLRQGLRSRPLSNEGSGEQERFLLVLLRRSSAGLNVQALEAAARSAWDDRFGRNADGSNFVESDVGETGFL